MTAAKRWLIHRQHLFTRDQLDDPNWPHPRPAHDPRLICMYIATGAASVIQVFVGVAPTSMQGRNGFDLATTIAFAALAIVGSALIIYAAYCRSQYWSFVTELAGCIAMSVTFAIYLWGVRAVPDYWATNSAWWSLSVVVGHLIRGIVIGRRFW